MCVTVNRQVEKWTTANFKDNVEDAGFLLRGKELYDPTINSMD